MRFVRSGIAVAAGFAVFSILFTVLGPSLGAILTTLGAGLMAGYLTAKIALSREALHGGAAAGLVAASLIAQPLFALPARLLIATIAAAAIAGGAWVRGQARVTRQEIENQDLSRRGPQGDGGEGRT